MKYRFKPRFFVIMAATGVIITSIACSHIDKTCSENITEAKVIKPAYVKEKLVDLGEYKVTHYCSCAICCGEYAESRPLDENGNEIVYTASGAVAEENKTIAVDPDEIPLGSIVYIDGELYVAQDVGGAIKGKRIDVYTASHDEAVKLGVEYASVYMKIDDLTE